MTSAFTAIPATFDRWVVGACVQHDALRVSDFVRESLPMPAVPTGAALVRIRLLNIHSATRQRIVRGTVAAGQTESRNYACGEVVASRDTAFAVGVLIACQAGWQQYQLVSSQDLPVGFSEANELVRVVNRTRSPWMYVFRPEMVRMWTPDVLLDVFGTSGMVAYFGLRENGPVTPRDTIAVGAASGSVGSLIAQLAKASGARVVGFAGGSDRCRELVMLLGIDDCVDYQSATLDDDLRKAFPEGIDLFADGVGGGFTEKLVRLMNRHGRLLSYGAAAASYAPAMEASNAKSVRQHYGISDEVERLLREKHIKSGTWTVDAFYQDRLRAEDDLSRALIMGQLKPHHIVVRGFDALPQAVVDLYAGKRRGKLQISFD
ncbi:hypothetical protein C7410_10811 [Paraburkholderia silvatlantica]|uniref:Alcohol dehydrogenase-like C-terminal domain-containing protein n=1 Tax=Paraburkholderia silvatlantica TaxID=321895 RepID=A0A2V4UQU1_9BURK|nr:zinc-binding dehydrogenase [Paraburkholderia silvatlantica]PYE23116.1 hypothetical protein C7410_10811 [Paraburkholderia silvatlantica]